MRLSRSGTFAAKTVHQKGILQMTRLLATLPMVALVAACGGAPTKEASNATIDPRECAKNFTVEGSFLSGKTFKTRANVAGIGQATALKRAAQFTAEDGWNIASVNESLGIISASQTVSYGNGKTAPLNISVSEADGGVAVSMTYALSGGVSSPETAVKEHFCKTIEAVAAR